MATIKPRIQVTLDQDVYDSLRAFASVAGESMSSIVSGLVTANVDTFAGLGKILTLSQSLDASARAALADTMSHIESDLLSSLSELSSLMDGSGGYESAPLPINKGVRFSKAPQKGTKKVHNLFLATNNSNKDGE